jgi:mono/diheme cytochrome c family protein
LEPLFSGHASRIIRALTLAACTGATACSRSAPAAQPAAVDASALFTQACAKCHGGNGGGGLAMVANGPRPIDFTSSEWQRARSDEDVARAIRTGSGAMPPFADVLTAPQIAALSSYVRTLKRTSPAPVGARLQTP